MAVFGILFAILMALFACAIGISLFAIPVLGIAIAILCFGLVVFSFIFWIWMLVDCIRNENITPNERLIWTLVIIFTHSLGALIYFCVSRSKRRPVMAMPPMA